MAFRWRADDGPTLNAGFGSFVIFQGIRTSIAKKPYNFVIFQGGGGPGPLSPFDPPMGCTGSSESTLVKMPHCWKPHVAAHMSASISKIK